MLLHGGEKVGKSTFAAGSSKAWFLPTEEGLKGVDAQAITVDGKARIENWGEFLSCFEFAEQNLNQFETLVIDSGDWLESMIFDNVCATYGTTNIAEAAGGYGKGYLEALGYWRNILMRLDRLNAQGKTIVIICHSKAVLFNDPTNEPYDLWTLKLWNSKKETGSLELLKEWADVIGFAANETYVSETEHTKGQKGEFKGRATSTGVRKLHLEPERGFLAGNRYGLKGSCDLNWQAFMNKFST